MAWYPGAIKMELQPESDSQSAIKPTQFIVHSLAAPWTAKRTYEYWRDSTNLESHFGLGYEGDLGQYIGTQTKADANAAANLRADGTGAVSLESASNLKATDPWTAAQVEELIKLGVWLHKTHGIPLRLCRSASDPGFGWHKQFDAWNPNAHACPGPARITQFKTVVFPGIVARAAGTPNQEDDVALSTDDKKWIEDAIKRVAPAAVLTTDNIIPNPNSATAEKNPHITLSTAVQNNESVARRVDRTTAALTAQLAALTAVVGELAKGGGLDAAEIQAAAEAGAQAALDRLGDALTKES